MIIVEQVIKHLNVEENAISGTHYQEEYAQYHWDNANISNSILDYKKIHIQQLVRKVQTQPVQQFNRDLILLKLSAPEEKQMDIQAQFSGQPKPKAYHQEGSIYLYKDTGLTNRVIQEYSNFFAAFFHPYSQHGDILLVPDDIWIMISLYFSKYIEKHSQTLRKHFVKHEGKQKLTIVEYAFNTQDSLQKEKEWDYYFQQILKLIKEKTVQNVVDALKCDFSTTNQVYELISTSIIMSSLKNYFQYGRIIMACGVENVYMDGTREDWVKIKQKLMNLGQYDQDGELNKYIQAVGKILDQFLNTYDAKPKKDWWNLMMSSQERRIGSGSDTETYIQGWILHFFGIYQKTQIQDLPKTSVQVPIKLTNKFTKTVKQLQLMVDWVSVSKINEYLYKPDIGVCVVERTRTVYE